MHSSEELSRLERLTAIIAMLRSKKLLTSTLVSERFGISTRTVYRDMKAIQAAGIPIHTIEGKGYSLVEGYHLPPVMFTEEEANAMITAHNIILQNRDLSLVQHHSSAIEKLKSVLKSSGLVKAELLSERVAFMKNFQRESTSNSLTSIQKAITSYSLIDISYANAQGKQSSRTLEPQAIYHTQENWILIAWCRLRKAYREFRLDRIQELKVREENFESRNFVLLEYFQELIQLHLAEKRRKATLA